MTDRFPIFNPAIDSSGNTISGARLFFYRAGTSTKKDTYSDSDKTVPNDNPVVADSGGRFGDIFMLTDEQYKVVLAAAGTDDPPTTPIDTWDNLSPVRENPVADVTVSSKSANFNVLVTDKGKLFEVDASSGSVNATLLLAADASNGFEVSFKKVDSSSNTVVVDGNGAETIDGATTQTLSNQYDAITLVCDGTEWHVKSENDASESSPLPRGYIDGLNVTINATDSDHDLDITTGEARDSADGVNIELASAFVKQIDASWVAGTAAGAMPSSLFTDPTPHPRVSTTYYVHSIVVGGVSDIGVDTSAVAANLIADHSATAYRLLATVETDASSNISKVWGRGEIVQRVTATDSAYTTHTTSIPLDNTIPQNTEGDEILTVSITPRGAGNILFVTVNIMFSIGVTLGTAVFALFRDSAADAVRATAVTVGDNSGIETLYLVHEEAATATSSTTFKLRAGRTANTLRINGGSAALFNGTSKTVITIEERTP